jgi:MoCo/4Fe-4S cofactor protein with predicted Tat translocation signal
MTIHPRKTDGLDLTAIRARLAGRSGPSYWRSLDELAGTEEFRAFLRREFPEQETGWADATSRRAFLRVMGASLALAGVSGCSSQEAEKIVPYVRQPEQIVPGKPLWFASAISLGGYGVGVLAESHMGRPTMVEGNALHPDSLGGIDPRVQATVLTLYDPDRSQVVSRRGEIDTWDGFVVAAIAALDAARPAKGRGVRVLTETVTSPSLARLIREFLKELPEARWHQYEPVNRDAARAGARMAFGDDVAARHDFAKADVILSLDADFLSEGPGHLRSAREFSARREPDASPSGMNRLYVVEPVPTITGAMADHRLPLRYGDVALFAEEVARKLGTPFAGQGPEAPEGRARWVDAVAADLQNHKGTSLVVAGGQQPAYVHALAHAMNEALGNVGKTVSYIEPVEAEPVDQGESLRDLVRDMEAGQVGVLLILGGNPAYKAPADVAFGKAMAKVAFTAHLALHEDETSALCQWHVPEAHELEAWGDVRASDGTATIQQPLIAPLYGGRSALEVVAALLRREARGGYEIVRETWKGDREGEDFEAFWRTSVHDGLVKGTEAKAKEVKLQGSRPSSSPAPAPAAEKGLEVVFRPDPTIHDGRFANNGWLQELPKPLTKLTWDNAAMVSYRTAERLGLAREEVVELKLGGRTVQAPVWIVPGHADDVVSVQLGYGRTRAGKVGDNIGFNAYAIRTAEAPWSAAGLEVRKTGRTYEMASTQNHRNVETREASVEERKRDLVQVATLAEFREDPHFASQKEHAEGLPESMTLYPEIEGSVSRLDRETIKAPPPEGYAWGMVVNLNTCIGCNACVIGCQAENNIPVVGKVEVQRGREMQWIDVDRYYHGKDLDNPDTYHQPRLCMHCENAPCEVVCPVAATVHDAEGINNMVYNRCVGTRYCGNNCPYKVRHFNFFQYSDLATPSLKLLNNPDVTVRARGVMEKCTYCIQRINAARIAAESEGRRIRDGDFQVACEAACPTRAITFGDVNDPNSRVSKAKADPRNYGLLTDLNTRPRTTYIARLRNPNPELEPGTERG